MRLKIAARLEALAREFRTGTTDNGSADDELAVATDDEMFDLIDQELGLASSSAGALARGIETPTAQQKGEHEDATEHAHVGPNPSRGAA